MNTAKITEALVQLDKAAQSLRDFAAETAKDASTAPRAVEALNHAREIVERRGYVANFAKSATASE